MHLLLFLKRGAIFLTLKLVDKVVYAKLLNLSWDLISELIAIVTS
jgi:hypothetical protein